MNNLIVSILNSNPESYSLDFFMEVFDGFVVAKRIKN